MVEVRIPSMQAITVVDGDAGVVFDIARCVRYPIDLVVITGVKCRDCEKFLGDVPATIPEYDLCNRCYERWFRCK